MLFLTFSYAKKKKKKICVQSADFFRADNPEGMEARNEVNTRN